MPDGLPGADHPVKHQIILGEEDGRITLDVSDGNGNRMVVYLDGVVASRLGQAMAEKARAAAAKAADDPARISTRSFSSEADRTVSVGQAV